MTHAHLAPLTTFQSKLLTATGTKSKCCLKFANLQKLQNTRGKGLISPSVSIESERERENDKIVYTLASTR